MPFYGTVEFFQEECCSCHMVFLMTADFQKAMKATGATFYCPAGHNQHYTKTDLQVLRERLERSEREAAQLREAKSGAERARDRAEKSIKRLRKRSAAGVCPCCNRTFEQLANHMKQKHSQFRQLQGLETPKQLHA